MSIRPIGNSALRLALHASTSRQTSRLILPILLTTSLFWYWVLHPGVFQYRYNAFSCPGYITSPITHNETAIIPGQSASLTRTPPPDFSVSPFAYVFYATQAEYACSVLVNIDRLKNLFNTTHRIIVLVKPDLASEYLPAFTAQNATVIPYEPPQLADFNVPYYQDVLLKLVSFRLHHYIPSLKRVLVLDADQIILQSLDHVFDLPAVDLAAPRAYWLDGGFTSAFLLIALSDRLWNKVADGLRDIGANVFDMDLVNNLFKQTLMILPGDYATLNSHFETNDLPTWWQGEEPPRTKTLTYPPPLPPYPISNRTNPITAENERAQLEHERSQEIERINAEEKKGRFEEALTEVYAAIKVLHFTAVGKPWSLSQNFVQESKPLAHGLLNEQFRIWNHAATELCPSWRGNWDM